VNITTRQRRLGSKALNGGGGAIPVKKQTMPAGACSVYEPLRNRQQSDARRGLEEVRPEQLSSTVRMEGWRQGGLAKKKTLTGKNKDLRKPACQARFFH
jgi:hypothetical protein